MAKNHGLQIGIEAKIEYHPIFEDLGSAYESWRRSAFTLLQSGLSEEEIEKRMQAQFTLQWAWADSIATEAKQCFDQLETASSNQISQLKERIKAKTKKAKTTIKELEKLLTKPFKAQHELDKFQKRLMGLKSKVIKISSLQRELNRIESKSRFVKPDGNIAWCQEMSYQWKKLTSTQRTVAMRDLVCQVVRIAEGLGCAIAIESLDFSKKKARMSEEGKLYNEMLSNLAFGLFREALASRCKRFGVQLIKVNPAFTSLIGMLKFMAKYGLNIGTAAAMCIARRAMNLSEKTPKCLLSPEDESRHYWSAWNRVARYIKQHGLKRARLFQWTKALEGLLTSCSHLAEHQPSTQVGIGMGEPRNPCQSPMGEVLEINSFVQLSLGF